MCPLLSRSEAQAVLPATPQTVSYEKNAASVFPSNSCNSLVANDIHANSSSSAMFRPLASAITLELCAGSAGLTAAFRAAGCDGLAVDCARNPQLPKAPIIKADLTTREGQALVTNIIDDCNIVHIHIACPCGTSSKSRERPIPLHLRKQGAPCPVPLRSSRFPWGLPHLKGLDLIRVEAANEVYRFTSECVRRVVAKGGTFSAENPWKSLYWEIPPVADLANIPGTVDADFHQCLLGGSRPVGRRWRSNLPGILCLAGLCSGESETHKHEPFRIRKVETGWHFDTADEATYPKILCTRVADILVQHLLTKNFVRPPEQFDKQSFDPETNRKKLRASTGLFVRGNILPPLISEFAKTIKIALPPNAKIGDKIEFQDGRSAKILRIETEKGECGNSKTEHCIGGVYRAPSEFADVAFKTIIHPVDSPSLVSDQIKKNIFWLATTGPEGVAKFRCNQIIKLRSLVCSLQALEDKLHATADETTQRILEGKQLLAFESALKDIGYDDAKIVREILEGFTLTGSTPKSNVFPSKFRAAAFTTDQLKSSAAYSSKALLNRIRSSGDQEIDCKVWNDALDEVQAGGMRGPFTIDQVEQILGPQWVASRRFGLKQGPKIRCIDDLSESMINDTVSSFEKVELHSIDDNVAVAKLICESIAENGAVTITLSTGQILKGRLPLGTSQSQALQWLGKTFDLKAAYHQIPANSKESWAHVIAVWNPVLNSFALFIQDWLPFGAVKSVYAFLRTAHAIWALGTVMMRFVWVHFYDDFSIYEPATSSTAADISARCFFALLGWEISLEQKKNKQFSKTFPMLGININLEEMTNRKIVVSNKQDRVDGICEEIEEIIGGESLHFALASSVRGKIQFAGSFTFGREIVPLLKTITEWQFRSRTSWLNDSVVSAFKQIHQIFSDAKPRVIDCNGLKTPVYIFSDAAAEGTGNQTVTIGAVLLDTTTKTTQMFGIEVPEAVVTKWQCRGPEFKKQVIGQAELLPVLMSRLTWHERLRNRRVIHFIDNESAKAALIRGVSPVLASQLIISATSKLEVTQCTWSWYARVPSASNPADGPSRMRLTTMAENLFATVVPMAQWPDFL